MKEKTCLNFWLKSTFLKTLHPNSSHIIDFFFNVVLYTIPTALGINTEHIFLRKLGLILLKIKLYHYTREGGTSA